MALASVDRRSPSPPARGRHVVDDDGGVPVPALINPPWVKHRHFRVVLPADLEAALHDYSPRPLLEAVWQLLLEAQVRQSFGGKGGDPCPAGDGLQVRSGLQDAAYMARMQELECSNSMLQGRLLRQDEYLAQLRTSFYQELLHLKQRLCEEGNVSEDTTFSPRQKTDLQASVTTTTATVATATDQEEAFPQPLPLPIPIPAIAIQEPQPSTDSQTEGIGLSTAEVSTTASVCHEDKGTQTEELVPLSTPRITSPLVRVGLDGLGPSPAKQGELPPPRSRHLAKALSFAKKSASPDVAASRVEVASPTADAYPHSPAEGTGPRRQASGRVNAADGANLGDGEEGRISRSLLFSPRATPPPATSLRPKSLADPTPVHAEPASSPTSPNSLLLTDLFHMPRESSDAAVGCHFPCPACGATAAGPPLPTLADDVIPLEVQAAVGPIPVEMQAILTASSSFRLPHSALRQSFSPTRAQLSAAVPWPREVSTPPRISEWVATAESGGMGVAKGGTPAALGRPPLMPSRMDDADTHGRTEGGNSPTATVTGTTTTFDGAVMAQWSDPLVQPPIRNGNHNGKAAEAVGGPHASVLAPAPAPTVADATAMSTGMMRWSDPLAKTHGKTTEGGGPNAGTTASAAIAATAMPMALAQWSDPLMQSRALSGKTSGREAELVATTVATTTVPAAPAAAATTMPIALARWSEPLTQSRTNGNGRETPGRKAEGVGGPTATVAGAASASAPATGTALPMVLARRSDPLVQFPASDGEAGRKTVKGGSESAAAAATASAAVISAPTATMAAMAQWISVQPAAMPGDPDSGVADPLLLFRIRELERQRAKALLDGDLRQAADAHQEMRLLLKQLGLALAGAEDAIAYPEVSLADHIAAYLERRSACPTNKETFQRTSHRPFIDTRRATKGSECLVRLPRKRPGTAGSRLGGH